MTKYERESLTALYKALEYMECNNLPCDDVYCAILEIENHIK